MSRSPRTLSSTQDLISICCGGDKIEFLVVAVSVSGHGGCIRSGLADNYGRLGRLSRRDRTQFGANDLLGLPRRRPHRDHEADGLDLAEYAGEEDEAPEPSAGLPRHRKEEQEDRDY